MGEGQLAANRSHIPGMLLSIDIRWTTKKTKQPKMKKNTKQPWEGWEQGGKLSNMNYAGWLWDDVKITK